MNDGTILRKMLSKSPEPSLPRKKVGDPLLHNLNLALFSFPSSSHTPLVVQTPHYSSSFPSNRPSLMSSAMTNRRLSSKGFQCAISSLPQRAIKHSPRYNSPNTLSSREVTHISNINTSRKDISKRVSGGIFRGTMFRGENLDF